MAFDGSGTFDRVHNFVNDRDAGIKIEASRMDTEIDGIATGLSTCLTKDGQTLPTANLPMNSKKLTGLAAGSSSGDSVRYEQVPKLSTSNTFTASQTIEVSSDATLTLRETSASGVVTRLRMQGHDSGSNDTDYAELRGAIVDATDTSEDGEWTLLATVAGTLTNTIKGRAGVFTPSATGGDQGADTINATTLYEDGTSLSDKYAGLSAANTFSANNTFSATVEVGTFSTTGASRGQQLRPVAGSEQLRRSSADVTTTVTHEQFWNPNGTVGSIQTSASSTSYNTTSDGNLKDSVTDADKAAAIARVKAGRPVEFEFKKEPGVKHLGFIAQEMHLVHPEAVTPGDENTPWMMDHSKLVPVLWATVQDLVARVEALESA